MKSTHKNLDYIDASIDPRLFFKKYVSTRTPVIIQGLLKDSTFKANRWTDLDYLSTKAGHCDVMVEPLHQDLRQFGTEVERIGMPFHEFIDSLKKDEGQNHYLTTQYAAEQEDEEDSSIVTQYPPPTNVLKDDFPSAPTLTGNLVLQQVNLWIGKSKNGSSSGLHHDFHDNLYCLLLGHKRFVLFPPREAANLHPHGKIDVIHPNGLISYTYNIVRSDGLSAKDAARFRVQALEERLKKAKGKEKAKLEKMHNDALEAMMDSLLDDEGGDDDFADINLGSEEDEVDEVDSVSEEEDDDGDDDAENIANGRQPPGTEESPDDEEPSSFSRIPTAVLHKHLNLPTTAAVPPSASSLELTKLSTPFVINLNPGEMLYLPASWWHEVTSSSTDPSKDHVHMAFNYWFYPPDGLKKFEEPYADDIIWGHLRSSLKGTDKTNEKRKRDNVPGSPSSSKKKPRQ